MARNDRSLDIASTRSSSTNSTFSDDHVEYPFNDELDILWERCRRLVPTVSDRHRIHPLHIALALLYDGLESSSDLRLRDPTLGGFNPRSAEHVNPEASADEAVFERPLLWIAIERATKSRLPEFLDDHMRMTVLDPSIFDPSERITPQFMVGKRLFFRILQLDFEHEALVGSEDRDPILDMCSHDTVTALNKAKELYMKKDDIFMAPHHLLKAILEDGHVREALTLCRGPPSPPAAQTCGALAADDAQGNLPYAAAPIDLSCDDVIAQIDTLRPFKVHSHESVPTFPNLRGYAIDHTEHFKRKIKAGDIIDPIVGREMQIRRLLTILSRKEKNNAVLLGDPGVGKTAIADGLAYRIIKGDVPEAVIARVFSLDLGGLLASTACKSSYELILRTLFDEIADHQARGINAIIFIDEFSQITIGGYRADGTGIDAATLMKPYLAGGRLHVVGCCTFEDYRNTVEKDGALARCFSHVHICEPTVDVTVEILRGMKPSLERFHQIHINDKVFIDSAFIASQYFAHKRLPDSAVDLVDEACVVTKLGVNIAWDKLGKWKRRQVALDMYIQSLKADIDSDAGHPEEAQLREEVQRCQVELDTVKFRLHRYLANRQVSKPVENRITVLEREIKDLEKLVMKYSHASQHEEKVNAISDLFNKKTELDEERTLVATTTVESDPEENAAAKLPVVTIEHVKEVASWYRPIHFHGHSDNRSNVKVDNVTDYLSEKIIGQPHVVDSISSAVRCLLSGLTDSKRPVASFLLGGPSGSGKSLVAKELARALLGSEDKLIKIHGADYAEGHALSRLIGTHACTGFDRGGQLTECVRRKPFSVILIQDIEKASQEFRICIQTILDEGKLRDGAGKNVDFTNCIVIITTGAGQASAYGLDSEDGVKDHYYEAVRKAFPTEFFARIDELVIFRRITASAMARIVESRVKEIARNLARVQLRTFVAKPAKDFLLREGWSPTLGAQRLDSIIRTQILRPLAYLILEDVIENGWTLIIDHDRDLDELSLTPVCTLPPEYQVETPLQPAQEPLPEFSDDERIDEADDSASEDDSSHYPSGYSSAGADDETDLTHHRIEASVATRLQLQPQPIY